MTDSRHNLKVNSEQYHLLKTAKPSGYTWGEFLTESLQSSTDHILEVEERGDGRADYLICVECGRTENTITKLNARPCSEGIPVDE